MQYSIATAFSTILFASALTSAAVIQQRQASPMTIDLTIKTGDGDSAEGTSVVVGSLQTVDTFNRPLAGCTATIDDAGISCQAFTDASGQTPLGNVFNSVTTGIWSDKCDGSTGSVVTDAAKVGSICCADSLRFDSICLNNKSAGSASPPTDTTTSTTTSVAPPATTSSTSDGSQANGNDDPWKHTGHHEHDFPVSIQLDGLDELAVQNEIDSNGQPQEVRNAVGITDIFIIHTHKQVLCEAFANGVAIPNSQFKAGQPATLDPNGVNVDAVSCKIL